MRDSKHWPRRAVRRSLIAAVVALAAAALALIGPAAIVAGTAWMWW